MAFRIDESVVRGEIDNRVNGVVRGRIWVAGRNEPLALELTGNPCRDLAGRLLKFRNTENAVQDPNVDRLLGAQSGTAGDMTASRKVRVFDVPVDEAFRMAELGEKAREHLANCLYLEWFSEANGRVVIESVDYELQVSDASWVFTDADEIARAEEAAKGMVGFMQRLSEAVEKHKRGQKSPEEPWDEFDYEKFLKESDARSEKYGELLEKYGDEPGGDEKIDKAMGWTEKEDDAERIADLNEMFEEALDDAMEEPEPNPAREGIDWIRTGDGEIRHPLQHRCSESGVKYWRKVDELGLGDWSDEDVGVFVAEFQITASKLAGALHTVARGEDWADSTFIVALLKRALNHLHRSQGGLEAVALKKILPDDTVVAARRELLEIRQGILDLMDEFRGRRA